MSKILEWALQNEDNIKILLAVVAAAFSAIGFIIKLIIELTTSNKKQLKEDLADEKTKNISLKNENRELHNAKSVLEEKLKCLESENENYRVTVKDNIEKRLENGRYFFGDAGPYCTRCYDKDKTKILMHTKDNGWGKKYDECPECQNSVLVEDNSKKVMSDFTKSIEEINRNRGPNTFF